MAAAPNVAAAAYLWLLVLNDASEESDEDAEEEEMEMMILATMLRRVEAKKRGRQRKRTSWWRVTVPDLTGEEFKENFRLAPSSFEALVDSVKSMWTRRVRQTGRHPVSCRKAVAMMLWKLANTSTWRELGNAFGLRRGHAHQVVKRMLKVVKAVHGNLIVLPKTEDEWQAKRTQWAASARPPFPNTVGVLDGVHIPLTYAPPLRVAKAHFTRKHQYTMQTQALADHNLCFMDVCVGAPGTTHDARVFRKAALRRLLARTLPPHHYVLADSAFPSLPWLVAPYKDPSTQRQGRFNKALSKTRVTVEMTFGMAKARWRCLNDLRVRSLKQGRAAKRMIYVALIMHNWCVQQEDDVMKEWIETQSELDQQRILDRQQAANQQLGPGEKPPTLQEIYQEHIRAGGNGQPVQAGQQPMQAAPHVHVQLGAADQLDFDVYFTNRNHGLSAQRQLQLGQALRRKLLEQY